MIHPLYIRKQLLYFLQKNGVPPSQAKAAIRSLANALGGAAAELHLPGYESPEEKQRKEIQGWLFLVAASLPFAPPGLPQKPKGRTVMVLQRRYR